MSGRGKVLHGVLTLRNTVGQCASKYKGEITKYCIRHLHQSVSVYMNILQNHHKSK